MRGNSKIYCIGSNIESYECLKYLVDQGCSINSLLTLPSGSDTHVSDYYDLHEFCATNGIKVVDTTNVNSQETIARLREEKPDYLFTLGWSQLFKQEFISCFSKFIVGTHPSKLPYGRGRAPLPWTLLEDLRSSAVSFFKIDMGTDTGELIFQREFDIPPRTYVKDLYARVAEELGQGFYEIYRIIATGKDFTFSRQNEDGMTVRGKRTPSDGLIEFHNPIQKIERLVRAVSEPFPGAYCYYKDQKIIFWRVAFDEEANHFGTIGQILKKNADGLLVQFSDGNLWLNRPSFEDGTPIEMKFFRLGDKLGYAIQDELYTLKKRLR